MKIICIGRNYTEHIEELGNEKPDEPVIFMKPDSALLRNNDPFYLPDFSNDIHHEVEVVVRINRVGKSIEQKFAGKYYDEIGLGIDFTARDLQSKLKSKGLPWERAKGFNSSAPISPFISKEGIDLTNLDFHLDVNGKTIQKGNTSLMLFSIDEIIAYVSQYFTLKKGDLIYTGTPKGVGPVKAGDRLQGYLKGELMFDFGVK